MSLLVETYVGVMVVDLHVVHDHAHAHDETEENENLAVSNAITLARLGAYNGTLIHKIEAGFGVFGGDPTGTGEGGKSAAAWLDVDERAPKRLLGSPRPEAWVGGPGLVCLTGTTADPTSIASEFFIALADASSAKYADAKRVFTPIGRVVEGLDVLQKLGGVFVDDDPNSRRPLLDVRVRHVDVLVNPFPDPPGWQDSRAPLWDPDRYAPPLETTIEERESLLEWEAKQNSDLTSAQRHERLLAENRAIKLEILGDLPSAEAKPPQNVLFVCKLNPVTRAEDLATIFSRFGDVVDCEVVRDHTTGESLRYAFVEFAEQGQCEEAFRKMQNVVVDERRIKVDFAQSMRSRPGRWGASSSSSNARGRGGGGRGGGGGGAREPRRGGGDATRERSAAPLMLSSSSTSSSRGGHPEEPIQEQREPPETADDDASSSSSSASAGDAKRQRRSSDASSSSSSDDKKKKKKKKKDAKKASKKKKKDKKRSST